MGEQGTTDPGERRTGSGRAGRLAVSPVVTRPGASGQSRALPVVMMAATAVVLGTVLSGQLLGLTSPLGDSEPPVISQTSGSMETRDDGGQVVEIRHVSGDVTAVSRLELVVDATDACGERARLVELPAGTPGTATVEGADIFGPDPAGGVTAVTGPDGEWAAGEAIRITIDSGRCRIESGETVTVTVVHRPSGTIVLTERFTG